MNKTILPILFSICGALWGGVGFEIYMAHDISSNLNEGNYTFAFFAGVPALLFSLFCIWFLRKQKMGYPVLAGSLVGLIAGYLLAVINSSPSMAS